MTQGDRRGRRHDAGGSPPRSRDHRPRRRAAGRARRPRRSWHGAHGHGAVGLGQVHPALRRRGHGRSRVRRERGRVCLDGRDITALPTEARQVGILFQDDVLFPTCRSAPTWRSGCRHRFTDGPRGGIAWMPRSATSVSKVCRPGPRHALGRTACAGRVDADAVVEPRALLLDEPFSRLDVTLRQQIRRLVFDRARSRSLPVLLVTHDEADAEAAGGRVHRLGPS